jgi:hypothetical protein
MSKPVVFSSRLSEESRKRGLTEQSVAEAVSSRDLPVTKEMLRDLVSPCQRVFMAYGRRCDDSPIFHQHRLIDRRTCNEVLLRIARLFEMPESARFTLLDRL